MVLYEVSIKVDPSISSAYAEWLAGHVQEVLSCRGFLGATTWQVAPSEGEGATWCTHFRLESREALERYLREDAPRLRQKTEARFGGKFSAVRRVLTEPREFV